MNTAIAVLMTITMFTPNGKTLKEDWSIIKPTNLEHCLTMNEVFAQGSPAAAMTVQCKVLK